MQLAGLGGGVQLCSSLEGLCAVSSAPGVDFFFFFFFLLSKGGLGDVGVFTCGCCR